MNINCATTYNGNSGTTVSQGSGEFEGLYKDITGTNKTMTEHRNTYVTDEQLQTAAGSRWKASYAGLMNIGVYYWLGGSSCNTLGLWDVSNGGYVYWYNTNTFGVRPVVSLKYKKADL